MTTTINTAALAQLKAAMANVEIGNAVTRKYIVTIEYSNIFNEDGSNMTSNVSVYADDENEAKELALWEKKGLKHLGYIFGKTTVKAA